MEPVPEAVKSVDCGVDVSRTERLVVALAEALAARSAVEELKLRYTMNAMEQFGEAPLAVALKPREEFYVRKLDALRAVLVSLGLPS